MTKLVFSCKDEEEQFYAKVKLIEIEKQKDIDRAIAIEKFNARVRENIAFNKKLQEINDDDYQRDVDHDLSMGVVTE